MRELLQNKARDAATPPKPGAAVDAVGAGPSRSARLQSKEFVGAMGGASALQTAAAGVQGVARALPFQERIQAAFGQHDLGGAQAFVGGAAAEASQALGAEAFAHGENIAFAEAPDLHTAAHEAAHVVQQRAGIQLENGQGKAGDEHERHADAVADRVVAGQSAVDLLQRYMPKDGAASKGVQLSPEDDVCVAPEQAVCEDPAAAEPAMCEIDLEGPKMALLERIRDTSWVEETFNGFQVQPHPDHAEALMDEIAEVTESAAFEAEGFAARIAECNDLAAIQALSEEFDVWQATVGADLCVEMSDVLDIYTQEEAGWLEAFKNHGEISADPVSFNQSANKAKLTFVPGMTARTIVETTISWNFTMTTAATAAKVAAWTPKEQTEFKATFQKQLDDVWGPKAQKFDPFRADQPKDFLLANQPEMWSQITSNFEGKVSDAAAGAAHFAVTANKEAAGESNRSFVAGGGGAATFHFADQSAGYDAAGKETGDQHTLAHEWLHMVGNPDEYAENSKAQADLANSPDGTSMGSHQEHFKTTYSSTVKYFDDIIANKDAKYTAAQIAQAQKDKNAFENPYSPGTDGFAIYDLSRPAPDRVGRIPDSAFAIRGLYDPAKGNYLRPGAASQRGGTHISTGPKDQMRLSDRGNQVRPYMREGVLIELNKMLKAQFTPEVVFEHNMKDMAMEDRVELLEARLNRISVDLAALQAQLGALKTTGSAPASAEPRTEPGCTHDHH